MVKPRSIVVLSGILFFAAAVVLFAVAVATGQVLGPLAMTAAQLGVLTFYWFPWSTAWRSHEPVVAIIFAVLSLVVSLWIITWSGTVLRSLSSPFVEWGPFLIVHAVGNIALALRPRIYLWWMLGVWTVGSLGVLLLLQPTRPGWFPPPEVLLTTLVGNAGGSGALTAAAEVIFWLISLASFAGTAAGLGFAMAWRRRRLDKEAGRVRASGAWRWRRCLEKEREQGPFSGEGTPSGGGG